MNTTDPNFYFEHGLYEDDDDEPTPFPTLWALPSWQGTYDPRTETVANQLLGRRTDWVGAAFYLPALGLAPGGTPGCYRVTGNRADGYWDLDWIGHELPK